MKNLHTVFHFHIFVLEKPHYEWHNGWFFVWFSNQQLQCAIYNPEVVIIKGWVIVVFSRFSGQELTFITTADYIDRILIIEIYLYSLVNIFEGHKQFFSTYICSHRAAGQWFSTLETTLSYIIDLKEMKDCARCFVNFSLSFFFAYVMTQCFSKVLSQHNITEHKLYSFFNISK